jgi:hypothetical protein
MSPILSLHPPPRQPVTGGPNIGEAQVSDGIYFIALEKDNTRAIRFYDFAKRRSRLIQALGAAPTEQGLTVSPNRKTFPYTASYTAPQDGSSNLMLVENFR